MQGIAIDRFGSAHVTGFTTGTDFPTRNAYQARSRSRGQVTAFVTKFTPTGRDILWSTYLGGTGAETARGIAAVEGEAFVTGETRSIDFPLKSPLQGMLKGTSDAFVTRIKIDGLALGYSTYLGGTGTDDGWAIAVDSDQQAYVTGRASGGFPLKNSLFDPLGNTLLFVTKLQPGGSASVFSTLLASNVSGIPEAIVVNSTRDIFVGGSIVYLGDGFSVVPSRGPPLQPTYGGGASDGFVYRLDTTGTFFDYASFLGGSQGEEVTCLALGEKQEVYVGGLTGSANFPHSLGAHDANHSGQNDGFVARVDTLNYPDDPPYLTPGVPAMVHLTTATPLTSFKRYRIVIPPGLRAIVTATDPDPLDANAIYARYNGEARPHTFDHAAEERGRASQRLVLSETQVGELYLYVQATRVNGPSNVVTLKVDAVDFALERIAPRRIAAGSPFHAVVRGAGFRSDSVFTIAPMNGGRTIASEEIRRLSSSHVEAVFDLTGQPPGMYRLKGFNPNDGTDGLENALEVVPPGVPGILDVRLGGRDTVRLGRSTTLRVIYENVGDEEMTAPILRLRAPVGVELRLEDDPTYRGNILDLLAVNPDGPAGILTPGSGGSIPVVYRSSVEGTISFTLERLTPGETDTIAWSTLQAPQGFSAAEWNTLRVPLGSLLGDTWAAYQDSLGDVAARLLRRGLGGSNVLGVRELFRRVVMQAKGIFPGSAVVGRAIRSPSNSVLAGASVVALEGGQIRSSAVTDSEGRFALECLEQGMTYQLRMSAHDVGLAQATLAADDMDLFGVELRGIEASTGLLPIPSSCAAYTLPGKALEAPQSLFTPLKTINVQVLRSQDPNEKDGPEGEGPKRHISLGEELIYTIHFENEGTAPALTVTVMDPADPSDALDSDLDRSTFRLLDAGVGDHVFSLDAVPGGTSQVRQGYSGRWTQPGVRTATIYSGVEARCDFDPLTGRLSWTFETVNPATGERAPGLPTEGFLPPNSTPPMGEGWVSFSIYPRQDLASDTDVRNDGAIVFDDQAPVSTASIFNLVWFGSFNLRTPRNPYPANGTLREIDTLGLYLSWEGDPRSTSYDLWLWKDGETRPAQPTAPGLSRTFHVPEREMEEGTVYHWQVRALDRGGQSAAGPEWRFATSGPDVLAGRFRRGDANTDARRDISDATSVLAYLFTGGVAPSCRDAADSNDDGVLNISDPSFLLAHLFLGTTPVLPLPFRSCGPDPTSDGLTCESYDPCK